MKSTDEVSEYDRDEERADESLDSLLGTELDQLMSSEQHSCTVKLVSELIRGSERSDDSPQT